MDTKRVKDIMVPLQEYGIVDEDSTLINAIMIFDEAHRKRNRNRPPHRAVLVVDKNKKVVGKLGQLAFLKALEPQHNILTDMSKLSSAGVSEQFIASVTQHYRFFQEDLSALCAHARHIKVKDVMHPVAEHIDENASLGEAIYKIVTWETLSVLVTRGEEIVGILRLSDICNEVAEFMKRLDDENQCS
jgi:CBS domain-containing protein